MVVCDVLVLVVVVYLCVFVVVSCVCYWVRLFNWEYLVVFGG